MYVVLLLSVTVDSIGATTKTRTKKKMLVMMITPTVMSTITADDNEDNDIEVDGANDDDYVRIV